MDKLLKFVKVKIAIINTVHLCYTVTQTCLWNLNYQNSSDVSITIARNVTVCVYYQLTFGILLGTGRRILLMASMNLRNPSINCDCSTMLRWPQISHLQQTVSETSIAKTPIYQLCTMHTLCLLPKETRLYILLITNSALCKLQLCLLPIAMRATTC